MKVVAGLGNPGSEYDETRHNVGWWVLDQLAYDWHFGAFRQRGFAVAVDGTVNDREVRLIKPTAYMNRSGWALAPLTSVPGFEPARDLLVVVDDAALDVGRVRLRHRGGAGGHNGLRSVSSTLGTDDYPRLRVGVGVAPEGADLAAWVLSPMTETDEDVVVELLPELARAVETWIAEGIEAAMNRYNR